MNAENSQQSAEQIPLPVMFMLPVHPKCRVVHVCTLAERVSKLRTAGETVAADSLVAAVNRAIPEPGNRQTQRGIWAQN